jgi:hypothetical protein
MNHQPAKVKIAQTPKLVRFNADQASYGPGRRVSGISALAGLKAGSLQICDTLSFNGDCSLLLCDCGFESTPNGSAIIRQAINCGCPVLIGSAQAVFILDEIRETGGIREETYRDLAAYALYKCIESDARQLAALQSNKNGLPMYSVSLRRCRPALAELLAESCALQEVRRHRFTQCQEA